MTKTAWLLVVTVVAGIGLIAFLFSIPDNDADQVQAEEARLSLAPELVPPAVPLAPPAHEPVENRVPVVVPEVTRVPVVVPDVTASPVVIPELTGSPVVIPEETRVPVMIPEVTVMPEVTRVPVVVTEVTRVPVVIPEPVQPRQAPPPVAAIEVTDEPATTTTEPVRESPAPAVTRVVITTERAGGHKIGPDMYQATTYGTARVLFRWESSGESGKVTGEKCTVISKVTGPGDYLHTDRSASCSGRMRGDLLVSTPGIYTITTTVTGPDGSEATGSLPFEIVAG
ncbi:hypothetical protein ONR57_12945 [Hoyosella sp. YIM 151337]|uniref:hypothetical protein n=1 Tax=Hoyosella sp. YIM 151337 TaxID=2992742 RepID=UPI0022354DCA|nr:hypothetical protein [Hoyosella sp. YIM 151337]MCW4354207.1 hypothetical protein [Hoyosella sp. YIM 151337]